MFRLLTGGLILLPLLGLFSGAVSAATEFQDVPYLQARINQVLEQEPTGAEVEWHNEATGNRGVIRVLKTYFPSPDSPCRDYERTTRLPGGAESLVTGTGCRGSSGRWQLKEREEDPSAPESPALESAQPSVQPSGQPSVPDSQSTTSSSQSGGQSQSAGQGAGQGAVQGAGQGGDAGQIQTSLPTSVLPEPPKPKPAVSATAPEVSESAAKTPSEGAPDLPPIELPTRSD